MKQIRCLLFTAAVLSSGLYAQLLPQASPKEVGISKEALDRIKPFLENYVTEGKVAGGTALIARRGKVAYFETFGVADKDTKKPMTKDAIFRIYSMTKPIITVGLMTLYEEGKFSLLDPVSRYLPEFTNMKVVVDKTDSKTGRRTYYTEPAERQITVLDLLRHTMGQSNAGPRDEQGKPIIANLNYRAHTLAEGTKMIAAAPLLFQPGTGWFYSPGPDVAGRLIEVLSGKTLDVFLEERIFRPLHMPDTGFWVPEAKWNRLATLYDSKDDGTIVKATDEAQEGYKKKPIYLSGSGGLASTTVDYLRFAQMLLNGGELEGVRILSPKTIDLMSSDLLGDLPVLGGGDLTGYGFGLTVAVNKGPAKTASIGSAGEYYWEGAAASIFFVDPKEKLLTVYMVQKRRGLPLSRNYKRMVYQTIAEKEN